MAMTLWNEVADLERRMDDLFRGWSFPRFAYPTFPPRGYVPAIDVFQRGEDLVVRAELPGIDPEKDVKVSVEEGVLVVSGERKSKSEVKEQDYYRLESSYGSFQRRIPLPEGVDESKIKAEYKDGILEVVAQGAAKAPAAPAAKAVQIPVTSPK